MSRSGRTKAPKNRGFYIGVGSERSKTISPLEVSTQLPERWIRGRFKRTCDMMPQSHVVAQTIEPNLIHYSNKSCPPATAQTIRDNWTIKLPTPFQLPLRRVDMKPRFESGPLDKFLRNEAFRFPILQDAFYHSLFVCCNQANGLYYLLYDI